jgi:glycerophosphoryl diester phosphodiesterase
MRRFILLAVVLVAMGAFAPAAGANHKPDQPSPLVIGHRGTPGYLPDHTLPGYALAIKLGADYIEPDLVATKDGHLIARHEPNITATTDVASHPEFAPRRRENVLVDGIEEDGWFASDFTLKEIKTLRAVQPLAHRPQRFSGRYKIPTFEQVIRLAKKYSKRTGRTIGIYPETKHPTYHRDLGLKLEGRLLSALRRAGWDRRRAPVFLQSFEQSNLQWLNRRTNVRLIQLVDAWDVNPDGTLQYVAPSDRPYDWTVSGRTDTFGYFATDAGLSEVATYADGIGPWKPYIHRLVNGVPTATDLVDRAHAHGLLVHPYTFRDDAFPAHYGNPANEYLTFYGLGVDGVFSDFADTAFAARELFWLDTRGSEDEE